MKYIDKTHQMRSSVSQPRGLTLVILIRTYYYYYWTIIVQIKNSKSRIDYIKPP